ncbi:MAG TPA: hypothetical protein VGB52_04885 [Actinomycetota bacterium]
MRRIGLTLVLIALLAAVGGGAAYLFGVGDDDGGSSATSPSPSPSAADLDPFRGPFEQAQDERPCCPTGVFVRVNEGCLNVRSEPGTNAGVRACAANGSLIYADLERAREATGFTWVRVLVTAEEPYVTGWVAREFVAECDQGASVCAFTNGVDLAVLRADIDNRLEDATDDGIDDLSCDEDATRVLIGDTFRCSAPRESGETIDVEVIVMAQAPHFDWRVV